MVDLADTHNPQAGYLQALRAAWLLIVEYRRAIAAEKYYASLRRMSTAALAQEGIARCHIPRRVFDEFYAFRAE